MTKCIMHSLLQGCLDQNSIIAKMIHFGVDGVNIFQSLKSSVTIQICESWVPFNLHYYILGLFCNPNIIANNKERCFWNLAVANHNSSQILKLLRYHNIRTRTIASPSQLPNLIQSQNFSDYNCFYPLFAINTTSETICNKPITATI